MNRCAKHGKRLCIACGLQTVLFPIEHLVWAKWLGPLFGLHL